MLLIGVAGTGLSAQERRQIAVPQVSGLVLFTRNFVSRQQVQDLVAEIRAVRSEGLLICVDQEGGPVQRFRDGFTRLPALASLGAEYDRDASAAIALTEEHAWVMASELRAIDVDISFAPVVDLARGNRAIGLRALHADPAAAAELAQAYVRGMHLAGMAATLKHFPGHGSVAADTHTDIAVDPRGLEDILATDLQPFVAGIDVGAEAVMMAHVVYPAVDTLPAGQSAAWIHDVLRRELGFRGIVFSDDISMAAAGNAGDLAARVHAHLDAGCDLVLACQPEAVEPALAAVRERPPADAERVANLRGAVSGNWDALVDNPQRRRFIARVTALNHEEST